MKNGDSETGVSKKKSRKIKLGFLIKISEKYFWGFHGKNKKLGFQKLFW